MTKIGENMTKVYLNTETNEYPLYVGDIALLGIEESDLPAHIVEVEVVVPDFDMETHILSEETPKLGKDGKYHAVINLREYTEEEKEQLRVNQIKRKVMRDQAITEEEAQLLINR